MTKRRFLFALVGVLAPYLAKNSVAQGPIDLNWSPQNDFINVGETFRVRLFATSNTGSNQPFANVEMVFTWDNDLIRLLRADQGGAYPWLFALFPDDAGGDNINEGVAQNGVPNNDGDAYYITAPPIGDNPTAFPINALRVTTLEFEALQVGCAELRIVPGIGNTETAVNSNTIPPINLVGALGAVFLHVGPDDLCSTCEADGDCDDGLFCSGAESCVDNVCQAGTPVDCTDGVSCTTDTCNEATDSCDNIASDAACDDGSFCNGAETCDAVLDCQPGVPPALEDGVGCTVDTCDEVNDVVVHTPNDGLCNDQQFCNGNETCDAVLGCQPGIPPALGDGVNCTVDTCDEVNDVIIHTPNDGLCNDQQFCNGTETCDIVLGCQPGSNPCPGQACDEETDACVDCLGDPDCDDGLFCNGVEVCSGGVCQAGTAVDCDDAVACTIDSCNEVTNACDHVANNTVCDDGAFCNGVEICDALLGCQAGTNPCPGQECHEDTDSCTDIDCDADEDCNDGLFCNGIESCVGSVCQGGTPVNCADGVPCTNDSCNEATDACDHVPNNAACDDGLFCNGIEVCDVLLGCQPGTDPCAGQACDEVADACSDVDCNGDEECDDGLFCNGVETCNTGQCAAGTSPCSGGSVCNESTDTCESTPAAPPPPPPPPPPNGLASGQVGPNGALVLEAMFDNELASARVIISDGSPGTLVRATLLLNDGPPGRDGDQTFEGFADVTIGTTLEVTSTLESGTFTALIEFTVPLTALGTLDLDPEGLDLHVFNESAGLWVLAGTSLVGESSPTDVIGDYGYFFGDTETVTYWAMRDALSLFAVGPAQAVEEDEPVAPAGLEETDLESESEPVEELALEPETETDTVVESEPEPDPGPEAVEDETQPPVAAQGCGGLCGTLGMANVGILMFGMTYLQRRLRAQRP